MLEELLVTLPYEDKPCGVLAMDFAFELFASFFERQTVEKEWFRDCILNPEYGIPVLICRQTGKQWIILDDGSASMENIFLQLVDEDEYHEDIKDVNAETVQFGFELLCMCFVEFSSVKLRVSQNGIVGLVHRACTAV